MKNRKTINRLLISIPVLALVIFSAFKANNLLNSKTEMYQNFKTYAQNNIVPVLSPLRTEFESVLSAEEVEEINKMRAKAKILIEEKHKMLQDAHKLAKDETIEYDNSHKETMKIMQKDVRKIITTAWSILDNHEDKFDEYQAYLEPFHKQWKEDIHTNIKEKIGKIPHHDHKMCGKEHPMHQHVDRMISPILFILWDPQTNFPFSIIEKHIDNFIAEKENIVFEKKNNPLNIFPNPASNQCSISFEIENKSKVTIVLKDRYNTPIRQIINKKFDKGEYTENLKTTDLASGLYFIEITTKEGKAVKKLIVN